MLAVQIAILAAVCAVAALAIATWRASSKKTDFSPLLLQLQAIEKALDRNERALREELARGRTESSEAARQLRDEVGARIAELSAANEGRFDSLRKSVEDRLRHLQEDNTAKLELMRQTVDEKLQGTLEQRLGESFKLVSERLEQVYRGLGEMQKLAGGVDDLKRVLTNVKTRGGWGEVQLGALLEQMLAPEQFERNVGTTGTAERVDFAIRLPGRDDTSAVVWLPIDAKFPQDDYQRLGMRRRRHLRRVFGWKQDASAISTSIRRAPPISPSCFCRLKAFTPRRSAGRASPIRCSAIAK